MKRILVLSILLLVAFSLVACGEDKSSRETQNDVIKNQATEPIEDVEVSKPPVQLPIITLSDDVKSLFNEEIYSDWLPTIDNDISKEKLANHKPINLLFVLQSDQSMTFSMLAVDPEKEDMELIIIPGEMNTTLKYKNGGDNLFAAYYQGEGSYSAAAVRTVLGVDVDFQLTIDTNGIKDIVDGIGQITVDSERFKNNSDEAEKLDRDGIDDYLYSNFANSDIVYKQHKVIEAAIKNILQDNSSEKLATAIEIMSTNSYMDTNAEFVDLKNLLTDYDIFSKNIETYELSIGNIGYVKKEEVEKVKGMLGNNAYFSEGRYEKAEPMEDIEIRRDNLSFGVPVQPLSDLKYVNDDYGFSLQLPDSWKERYIVWNIENSEVQGPKEASDTIVFSMVDDGKYIGDCFYIYVYEGSVDEVKAYYENTPMFEEFITARDNVSLVYNRPAELPPQLFEEPYLDLADRYADMVNEDSEEILKTVKFE
ncbi:LCP family glycopolymer transferase [Bacillus niameyensis]|uniref:LCP family glycopolymer transferase n=1 Tax=Bacillus niameyensis TaxID=1522308 RepID=UPI000783A0B0|nr:LCP family protein [Bacillus niameyensis]